MDARDNLHSFYYWQNNHVFHIGINDIEVSDLQEKLSFHHFSWFNREMRQTWLPKTIYILFVIGIAIMFSIMGYTILMLWICRKSFLSTIFLIIKVHSRKETNLDSHNNLHSFCYGMAIMFSSLGYIILML